MARPALLGGRPAVDATGWPSWPQWDEREERALVEVLRSGRWQAGRQVEAFEREFAQYQGAAEAVCVTNGTASLELALRALGVGPGDEVIVPSYTFAATALAVMTVGAAPVFVDVEQESLTLDPVVCEAAIGPRTRAIIPVHLGGHPADLDRLASLASDHSLALVEDAAHAHGAEWRGQRVGGALGCASFSFQTGKSLTSGDGGCLTTNDQDLASVLRSLREFGRSGNGELQRVGGNCRMTEFQAAVLRCGLTRLDEQITVREERVQRLRVSLAAVPGVRLAGRDPRVTRHPWYQVILRYAPEVFGLSKRRFLEALTAENVPLEAGYSPLHRLPLFRRACDEGRARSLPCPVSEEAADRGAVWMSFRMAMANEETIDTVAAAMLKIHAHADELGEPQEGR